MLAFICFFLALVCFALASIGVTSSRVNLVAVGLALAVIPFLSENWPT